MRATIYNTLNIRLQIYSLPPPPAPTEIRTQVTGFKVQCDNHYTIGAHANILCTLLHYLQGLHEVGFEPTQLTLPGLKSGSLDHSDIRAGCAPMRARTADLCLTHSANFCRIRTAL